MAQASPVLCCGDCRNALSITSNSSEIACTAFLEYRHREESGPCPYFEQKAVDKTTPAPLIRGAGVHASETPI